MLYHKKKEQSNALFLYIINKNLLLRKQTFKEVFTFFIHRIIYV